MQFLYFAVTAVVLYFVSDWLLLGIERARGKAFGAQRSVVFLLIMTVLTVSSFKLIELTLAS